jgi:fluoroquinolone transport system permease protein
VSRLSAALRLDLRLLWRYRVLYAGAVVAALWVLVLAQLPPEARPLALPFALFTDLAVVGYYFLAGLVLLEREEGSLAALAVSPLRFPEYLGSKLAVLTLLALAMSFAIVPAGGGGPWSPLWLVVGVVLTSLFAMLVGFLLVARYATISEFLVPSSLPFVALMAPMLDYFGVWTHPLLYLLPSQAAILLLRAAFLPVERWQLGYGVVYLVAWVLLLARLARPAFDRQILGRRGAR